MRNHEVGGKISSFLGYTKFESPVGSPVPGVFRKVVEDTKVICRNARRDAIDALKKLKKDSEITEDEEASYEKDVQKILDENTAKIDKMMDEKEKEIMQV